jgi:transposase InsO family protein
VLNEKHLRRLLRAYLVYYNTTRPHQALGLDSPLPREVQPPAPGSIIAIPEVGGVHHRCEVGVTAATLATWREQFLAGGQAARRLQSIGSSSAFIINQ